MSHLTRQTARSRRRLWLGHSQRQRPRPTTVRSRGTSRSCGRSARTRETHAGARTRGSQDRAHPPEPRLQGSVRQAYTPRWSRRPLRNARMGIAVNLLRVPAARRWYRNAPDISAGPTMDPEHVVGPDHKGRVGGHRRSHMQGAVGRLPMWSPARTRRAVSTPCVERGRRPASEVPSGSKNSRVTDGLASVSHVDTATNQTSSRILWMSACSRSRSSVARSAAHC